jgi:hypothetical protein
LTSETPTAQPASTDGPTEPFGTLASPDVVIGSRRVLLTPHNCFACGQLNLHGLRLDLHARSGRCWTEISLPERFEGWEGIAHGGIICTILDEVMAWAIVGEDAWAVTARLQVEFKRPIPVGSSIRGEVDRQRRRQCSRRALDRRRRDGINSPPPPPSTWRFPRKQREPGPLRHGR